MAKLFTKQLTRRQRLEALVKAYPHDMISRAIQRAVTSSNLSAFSDEGIENLFLDLREIEQFGRKMNAENRVRLAS